MLSLFRAAALFALALTSLGQVSQAADMTQPEMISFAKRRMSQVNDISSIELNQMYASSKMLILPISGTSWQSILDGMPYVFVSFLAKQYKVRETVPDIVNNLEKKYDSDGFESANTLVTRSKGYVFCIVDDGLRKGFESNKGFMRPFYGGIMPLYFERNDLFEFIRHHEASHCLDSESDGISDGQKFLSVMINETKADLNATLVYANRHGNFGLFYNVIKPMRMGSFSDVEHTTEDAVESLITGIDPASLKDVPFSKILLLREQLVSELESADMVKIMLRNAFEKQQMAEYLTERFEQTGQSVPYQISAAVAKNKQFVDSFIPDDVKTNFDMGARFNSMITATLANHTEYAEYIDVKDQNVHNFRKSLEAIGIPLPAETKARLVNYPAK